MDKEPFAPIDENNEKERVILEDPSKEEVFAQAAVKTGTLISMETTNTFLNGEPTKNGELKLVLTLPKTENLGKFWDEVRVLESKFPEK